MSEEATGPETVDEGQADGYAVVSRGYAGYVADSRAADVEVMDTHRWLGGRLIQ